VIVRLGEDAIFGQQDLVFAEVFEFLRSQLTLALSAEDIEEDVRAFFEKREPLRNGR
jgi:enoyl-CoA hydratase